MGHLFGHMFIVFADITTLPHIEETHLKKGMSPLSHHFNTLLGPGRTIALLDEIKNSMFSIVDEKISVDCHFVRHSHITQLLGFFCTGRHLGHRDCLESLSNEWE